MMKVYMTYSKRRFVFQQRLSYFTAAFIMLFCGELQADISFTFSPSADSNNTTLNILGLGMTEATDDNRLSVGSNGADTFIRSDQIDVSAGASISPSIMLSDGMLSLTFLGDFNSGSRTRPESLIRFSLSSRLTGQVDLNNLTGGVRTH